ncbi:MAG TPA: trigger factor [Candidatus Ornithoclostridium faecavium]|nr:trigger factor [Candidatus Ornithoclostridium faecavium]
MNYTKELLEKDRVKFTVEVSEEEWKNALTKAYEKNKGKFQIEGFRKGKVPRKVIENMYGVGVFFEDALDIILPETYGEIMDKESDLFPVDRPDIDIAAISDSTLKYTATVQLRPTVTLGAYTGIDFEKQSTEVSDEEVEAEIKKDLENAGSWEPIGDRAIENGDKCVIDFSGSVDGVKFEGGTAKDYTIVLGSGSFIPGFEDQMVGMKAGETKVVKVKFPEDYHAENLAGKDAEFEVVLHSATVKNVPALDDETVKDISEFDTVDDYKKSVKDRLVSKKEEEAGYALDQAIIEKVAENAQVDIPECMINDEAEDMVKEFEYRVMYQGGDPEQFYKMTGQTRENLLNTYKTGAAKNVKLRLVLQEIIKAANITVTDEEVEQDLEKSAEEANMSFEEFKKNVTDQHRSYLRSSMLSKKAFEFLRNNNNIK